MKAYDKKNGFTIIKKRLMRHENSNIKYRSFGCKFGGRYQPKKQIDINKHRDLLTTFNNSHNHTLFPNTEKYSIKYRHISDDVLKEI
ncbi:hypothetical protein Glove_149g129 [Diversispora epigaea]|uniref:FAR1 domain-containing protein n=1 Tax=Diversispora epigaea TaxID=1348612 RepID=A0A397ITL6_9GLOM|nr:hypothetical protein Glove_149g129 [Diversispora epigaea]